MSNVIKLYPKNAAENIDNVLEQAVGQYDDAIIIGWSKDGVLCARSSSGLKASEILWLVEIFKRALMSGEYSDDAA